MTTAATPDEALQRTRMLVTDCAWARFPAGTRVSRRMRALLFLSLLVLVQGCQYDRHAHLYTTDKPETTNVVGTYVMTSQTLARDS